ncbi:ATP-dependent sacrificial sulfur transferase LarE [bacterium]|nr:ATP-dependent sacrificial sulfur transferase LarE [bacterium]
MKSSATIATTEERASALEDYFRQFDRVVVAFSGGVDSTVVTKAAAMAIGERALAITADTESNTDDDLELCRRIAEEHGLNHEIIAYSELAIPNYAENPVNRCYFCKHTLYSQLAEIAGQRGFSAICDGSNADDVGDYRPGLKAVAELQVRSPLKELGYSKEVVRDLARHFGLPNRDKPSSPCLSSRIPYGSPVTREKLDQVGRAEKYLREELGLTELRCRHHGQVARLEVPAADFEVVLANREEIVKCLRTFGFHWIALDLAGFQSGSLNRTVPDEDLKANRIDIDSH